MSKNLKLPRLGFIIALLILSGIGRVSLAEAPEKEAWMALQQGKAVALMRHAYAPDTNETSPVSPEECANERNLSAQGANQAKKIAETLRANGIDNAHVYSSHLCRCIDTGVLFNFGEVENLPELNGYGRDRSRGPAQTEALRNWIKRAINQDSIAQDSSIQDSTTQDSSNQESIARDSNILDPNKQNSGKQDSNKQDPGKQSSTKLKNGSHVLITHGFNISDLMGIIAKQGEVLIVGVKDNKLVNLHQFSTPIL